MFDNDEGTVSTPPVPCAYAGSEFLLNANSEGQAQHHVLPYSGRKQWTVQWTVHWHYLQELLLVLIKTLTGIY